MRKKLLIYVLVFLAGFLVCKLTYSPLSFGVTGKCMECYSFAVVGYECEDITIFPND